MVKKILVVHASRKGSTEEIARAVAKELEATGVGVEVAEMQTVSVPEDVQAVVIGAPVYAGHIVPAVAAFVAKNRPRLEKIPVAAFAVGIAPVMPQAGPVEKLREELRKALSPLQPVTVTMFAGKLDPQKLSFVERTMTKMLKVPTGDFRDWEAIRAWAKGLPPGFRG
ncbi:MAG: flavodoxin domain-containing protein [Methanomicrobiales archaeon]|nr:flavodoxin domain-containing protein [Methanomicrobiales archaeon]